MILMAVHDSAGASILPDVDEYTAENSRTHFIQNRQSANMNQHRPMDWTRLSPS
jgi:hypothetical protein